MIGILTANEVDKAPLALRRAAECGTDEALVELSKWFAAPPYGEPDAHAAEEIVRPLIQRGSPGALTQFVRVRYFYRRYDSTPAEQRETYQMLAHAVASEPPDSEHIYLLGLLTSQGFGTAPDPSGAFSLHQRAAGLGNADAMFELYAHYQSGLGVPRDELAAFAANLAAAEAGSARAMYNMGAFCANGTHVAKDMGKAAEWYKRASEAGHLGATAMLAVMYATGDGVQRDREYAQQLFDEAEYLGYDTAELREMVGL
ncbi:MAG: tetratricopeptide repeat protein [Thermoanaerobaculia bacterium]